MNTQLWAPAGVSGRGRRWMYRPRRLDGTGPIEVAAGAALVVGGIAGLGILVAAAVGGFLPDTIGIAPSVPVLMATGALTATGRLSVPRAVFLSVATIVAGTAVMGDPALIRTGAVLASFAGVVAVLSTHRGPVRVAAAFGILITAALGAARFRGNPTDHLVVDSLSIAMGYAAVVIVAIVSTRLRSASADRFSTLARAAPIGIWEHDLTRLSKLVDQVPTETGEVPNHLERHTLLADRAAAAVEVISANPAALDLPPLFDTDNPAARKIAGAALAALAGGRRHFGVEVQIPIEESRAQTLRIDGAISRRHGELDLTSAIVTAVDITAQRDAQAAIARQMADRTSLLATISHELRTPLTAILGFGAILRDRTLAADQRAEAINAIVAETRGMANVVEDLLVASRLATDDVSITTERVDLGAAARSAIAATGAPVALEIPSRIYVAADAIRIRQVLRNLLANALTHGGERIRIVADQSDDQTWIEVRDDGRPIPVRLRRAMFEPYRRGRETPGLTASVGLGLTICAELARLMSGAVEYHHDGTESAFRLTLPTWTDHRSSLPLPVTGASGPAE